MKHCKRFLIAVAVLVSLLSVAWCTRFSWMPALGGWLDVGQVPSKVDYVLSLPGDEDYRPFVAAAMINQGLAQQALIIENEPTPEVQDGIALSTSEVICRVYRNCRVPDSKLVVLSGKSTSTSTDIEILSRFLADNPLATVAIVTSSYHTRRSRWTFQRQLGESAERLRIIAAPNGDFATYRWWRTENGFLFVILEYVKLCAYLVIYGRLAWWLGAGVLAFAIWKMPKCKVGCAR